ncbi:hypothetical protein ABI59_22500 [Acidobacteria bacterium Mor1]|nr:hypothetical protein ABI59_22500 [Acidobacteria bacterium Mor1]
MQRLLLLGLMFSVVSPGIGAADWLQWGGPKGDYTVDVDGLAETWPESGPPRLWKRPLGEGYPSILHKDARLYTMYRDAESGEEAVVALDAGTGSTIWEHRYEVELWEGMIEGFGLGPNSTPLIAGDRIVSISVDGVIRCLDLADGKLRWQHDLPAEYGRRSRDEEYGYSAIPLLYEGKVIVMVGGDDHAVVAYDPKNGETVWKSAPGGVSYAPPLLTSLGGRDQYLYFSPEGAIGLDPATGKTLWFHEIEYNNGNHLTGMVKCDENHVWAGSQFPTGGGRLLEIRGKGDDWTAEQVWFETYLRASHWTNIRLGDHIYGSTGGNGVSLMTAFDWKTGEVAWRHRGFHKAQALYADDKLLFLDEDGNLSLARVSPEKFELLASAEVTDSVSWSLPTLVDTTLYLRDNTHIMALDLADKGAAAAPQIIGAEPVEATALMGRFGAFIVDVEQAEDKQATIDAYLARHDSFPVIEEGGLVHFVYRGEAPAVNVMGNFLERGRVEPLHRVAGTDLFFRSYRLAPESVYEYYFDFVDDTVNDPANPRRVFDDDGFPSLVSTSGWEQPAHLKAPAAEAAPPTEFTWTSKILENERTIKVVTPPGYDGSSERYPLVLVNYGDHSLRQGMWGNSLGNLLGASVSPAIVAFVPRVTYDDYGPKVQQFAEAVTEELLPMIDERFRTRPGGENRLMTGIASGSFASLYLALSRPETLGNVALQSFYFREEAEEELRGLIADGKGATSRVWMEWSSSDLKGGDLDCEGDSRELAGLLTDAGYDLATRESTDGGGWGMWRASTGRILEYFFGK